VEVVRRRGEHGDYLFVLNHTAQPARVPLTAPGTELLSGEHVTGDLTLAAHAAAVVRLTG
jgi:beta-galactosidase